MILIKLAPLLQLREETGKSGWMQPDRVVLVGRVIYQW